MKTPLNIIPVEAPVRYRRFDLYTTLLEAVSDTPLQDGDVFAISSKYVAISQGRVVELEAIQTSDEAYRVAERYSMNPRLAQLVLDEAEHVFGGITHNFNGVDIGFLLTYKHGVIAPNAGLDRSNIPSGQVVLLPEQPYETAEALRLELRTRLGVDVGVILTDSWLMPGRIGTTGVAIATAGFQPVQDERGKIDLFGNPMQVTQRGIADTICAAAQLVMGETAEAIPIAVVRNSGVRLSDAPVRVDDVAIPWQICIYVGSLGQGQLEYGLMSAEFSND